MVYWHLSSKKKGFYCPLGSGQQKNVLRIR